MYVYDYLYACICMLRLILIAIKYFLYVHTAIKCCILFVDFDSLFTENDLVSSGYQNH